MASGAKNIVGKGENAETSYQQFLLSLKVFLRIIFFGAFLFKSGDRYGGFVASVNQISDWRECSQIVDQHYTFPIIS